MSKEESHDVLRGNMWRIQEAWSEEKLNEFLTSLFLSLKRVLVGRFGARGSVGPAGVN